MHALARLLPYFSSEHAGRLAWRKVQAYHLEYGWKAFQRQPA